MSFRFFSEQQQDEIKEHLLKEFSGDELANAMASIDWACAFAESELAIKPGERRRILKEDNKHFQRIIEHAGTLRTLLHEERPLWNTKGIDWIQFDGTLDRLIDSATVHAGGSWPRGRPPEGWRDMLISVVYSVYPSGAAKRSSGSHFEETVRILLEFFDREVEDLHSVILAALRRRPDPPFTVKLKDPI